MGYPSIRFFPPHSPMTKKITKEKEIVDDFYRGNPVDRSENVADLKRSMIDMTIPYLHNYYQMSDSTTPSVSDSTSLWEFIKTKTISPTALPSIAILVFEPEESYVTKEVAMTMSKFPSVIIFRFTKKNALFSELKLEGWPAAGYVKSDHSSGSMPFPKNKNIPNYLVKMMADIANIPIDLFSSTSNIRDNIKSEAKVMINEDAMSNNLEEPSTISVVSIEDLLHGMRNSLRNEVGLFKQLAGDKLQALKNYVHTLAEFFPADRRETLLFLLKLSTWLAPMEQIDDTTYMDKLTELEVELHPWDIDFKTWSNCKGSIQGRRGYPCSMWSLFHTLAAVAFQKNQQFPVLDAIHGYVKEFFGCKECSGHFTKLVADDGALMISSIRDQVLWLWKAHNKVNLRLKGTLSEDPVYPKIQYPSETQCPECYGKETIFDEEKVLQHLLTVYSKPERTLQPIQSSPDRLYATNDGGHKSPGFFSGTDYWLFCIVYLSVALLLIFGYVHFRMRKGARFDISYFMCRKLKHHYTGKNNV
ncbi:sulfhydryl oxidase 2 isoform X2 [Folsomia candida]|nr:sulfhydryl oxidase 2 isoform X2 [Folsomia candida]